MLRFLLQDAKVDLCGRLKAAGLMVFQADGERVRDRCHGRCRGDAVQRHGSRPWVDHLAQRLGGVAAPAMGIVGRPVDLLGGSDLEAVG